MKQLVSYVTVWKSRDGWRWTLKSPNGRVLATSEAYSRLGMARKTAGRMADQLGPPVRVSEAKSRRKKREK